MSIFTDRRSLKQIGGLRAYLRQVSWSLRWQIEWRRRVRRTIAARRPLPKAPAVLDGLPASVPGTSADAEALRATRPPV